MNRAHYIGAPEFFHLDLLCRVINEAFGEYGYGTYLVGSSLERRDYRDVDVRFIMADEEFDRLFPEVAGASAGCWSRCSAWSLICGALSEWLAKRSGLPIDFQIQRMTQANEEFPAAGKRNALGVFRSRPPPARSEDNAPAKLPKGACACCGALMGEPHRSELCR